MRLPPGFPRRLLSFLHRTLSSPIYSFSSTHDCAALADYTLALIDREDHQTLHETRLYGEEKLAEFVTDSNERQQLMDTIFNYIQSRIGEYDTIEGGGGGGGEMISEQQTSTTL